MDTIESNDPRRLTCAPPQLVEFGLVGTLTGASDDPCIDRVPDGKESR